METSLQSKNFNWYTVMTFTRNNQFIMNKISFDDFGMAIEDYNMHGINIVATGLEWKPSLAVENCDKTGRDCDKYGIIVDLMNTVAMKFNFTWDVYKDLDDDWGMFPDEGR